MRSIILLIIGIVGVIFVIVFIVKIDRGNSNVESNNDLVKNILELNSGDHIKGNINAQVKIVEYSDFQCPACSRSTEFFRGIEEKYGSDIAFVYRHFPLSMIHRNATNAAYAVEAASLQGSFWQMHDILFDRQSKWSKQKNVKDLFVEYSKEIGIDSVKFSEDYSSTAIRDRVKSDINDARDLSLEGTPSIFINGSVVQIRTQEDLYRIIDNLLQTQ